MSELVIEEAETSGAAILAPSGRIDTSTSKTFETAVMAKIEGGERALVFDFDKLQYISSAGLRVVLLTGKRLKAAGGALVLCNMNSAIRDVFEISGFLSLFAVEASRDAAIATAVRNA